MQIVLLGAGGYHPNSRRHTACVMAPELGIVFDAGTASFRIPEHLITDRLDIFLSHAHLDHIFGLTSILGLFQGDEVGRIHVYGEAEKLAAVREHLFSPLIFPVKPNFTMTPLEGDITLPNGAVVKHFPLVGHPGGTVGYRLEIGDKALAYVTDTVADPQAPYVEHLHGLDLLIHEAYFEDDRREFAVLTGHSCVSDAVAIGELVKPKQLVLVHMNPRADSDEPLDLTEAKRRLPQVTQGTDGEVIEF